MRYLTFPVLCFAFACQLASAATLTINGSTLGDPRWNRPREDGSSLSNVGTNVRFDVISFSVSQSGNYSFLEVVTGSDWDNYIFLYRTSFHSSTPLVNFIRGNDDISGPGHRSGFTENLTAGTLYFLVSTGYDNSDAGNFTLTINGPGSINAFTPAAVPEPSTLTMGAVGIGLVLFRLRKRKS
ncbi:PEP-CTERM sorting domain-containing protein [Bryobacter aggregatus]|uniref:PEP-CTERM sorting domain-containing protein n=1 Tax=Bryobacter aggregatus TaxID=360054 RepID=UPI0004E1650E|nr:PEP-CTERM sorting domain-containing protein [Bryobacter aggregatus]